VIVIDPGHSGRSIRSRTTNGLLDFDYPNQPEMTETFDVSSCVAEGLRADGYRVIMTKKHSGDSVSLTERAEIANRAHADLAISVHNDHGQGPSFQATYSQLGVKTGGRYHPMYRGTGNRRTVFDHPKIARASDRAARIIARERTRAEGRQVRVQENSFTGRAPLEPGNLAIVQLLSDVPWVYNELGARTGGTTTKRMTLAAETGYAKGLLDGVEAAVPTVGAPGEPTSTATLRACLAARR
jgi:N-acetylmuramoyl-L-alanine amidase